VAQLVGLHEVAEADQGLRGETGEMEVDQLMTNIWENMENLWENMEHLWEIYGKSMGNYDWLVVWHHGIL
jgi:hypothetical protein